MSGSTDAVGEPDIQVRDPEQMKLTSMQLYNWGTFSGFLDIRIAEAGYLFVGPSGSGKSTILDAHASLTTPPKWVDFNVAAREAERKSKDRNLMTYVRGAWAQQTTESGEYASQFLRPDSTWTASAETYRDGNGNVVVLAQVLWVRGKSTSSSDVKRLYLVLEREFNLRELQFFVEHDFDVRRFKFDLPDAFVKDEFSAYQERFRRLLGIESERALRLLHKTQAAKNLGDLNEFMRDFMLEPPETFKLAEKLVDQFAELNDAHRAVVNARRQIETLRPARDESLELDKAKAHKNELDELSLGVDKYKEQLRKRLLEEAVAAEETDIAGMEQEAIRLKGLEDNQFGLLRSLQDQRGEQGGSLLEDLQKQLEGAEKRREKRIEKRNAIHAACNVMGWAPPDTAVWFTQRKDAATRFRVDAKAKSEELGERKYALRKAYDDAGEKLKDVRGEIAALERMGTSNIPSHMLRVREDMARALGIAEDKLPYAGELIEVRQEDVPWQGAIERVLNGFALSLLVDDRYYSQVVAYVNDTNLGQRLVYFRTLSMAAGSRVIGTNSLIKKLNFAKSPLAEWVKENLRANFDYECADTMHAFKAATRAITITGQVRHSATRHEKNDKFRVDDRGRWVLGFDNTSKVAHFQSLAFELVQEIERLRKELLKANEEEGVERERLVACTTISNTEWDEVDVPSVLAEIDALQKRLGREREQRPDLARLDEDIKRQEAVYDTARKKHSDYLGDIGSRRRKLAEYRRQTDLLRQELLTVALTPFQRQGLDARYARYLDDMALETVDNATTQVVRGINNDERLAASKIAGLSNSIEQRFAEFVRTWPAEAGGLDPKMASAPDFFAKLTRLETDGLPKFEQRFLTLLQEQSEQNLTRLSTQLDQERKAIRDRMALVNESLATAPFGQGTHLVIETQEKLLEDVVAFKQTLKASLSNMLSTDPEGAEQRFGVISGLVRRLASQETQDKNWRALVLDVRQHVEFIARELNEFGVEVEVYRSGAGKSGGQRQKLAATCLAAALRYQLGGQDRALPRFSTVFLDEAFDKADAEFTTMAMNIFKTFGFQMVVATPLKSVMTLEPFIGGACFVHIRDRKTSCVIPIDYDAAEGRLRLNTEQADAHETAAA